MVVKKTKILLDTHVLIWSLSDPNKLKQSTIDLIDNPKNIVTVSVATLWELEIKRSIGKIKLPLNFITQIQNLDYTILDIGKDHIAGLSKLPWLHRDPFDRILIAQSLTENITLITKDSEIMKYPLNFIEA